MKIQLDTVAKTIKLESNEKISKILETLKKLMPNEEWKEFTLETNTSITYWTNPTIIRQDRIIPWWQPPWYCSTSTNSNISHQKTAGDTSVSLNSGTYNIEVL